MLQKIDQSTLVEEVNLFRAKGITAHHLISLVNRQGDMKKTSGLERLQFLTYDSPKMRYILYQIHTYVLPHSSNIRPRKLLTIEDIPLNAYFWESVCNFVYVETEVLHAALTEAERVDLIKRFNDSENSLITLIIMYQVSAQGVNLDKCCSRVLVATSVINAPLDIQAWSRVIRVCHRSSFIPVWMLIKNICT